MMSYFSLAVEDLGENWLYLLVACNVMLSYKLFTKVWRRRKEAVMSTGKAQIRLI